MTCRLFNYVLIQQVMEEIHLDLISLCYGLGEIVNFSREPKATGRNLDLSVPWQLSVVEVT